MDMLKACLTSVPFLNRGGRSDVVSNIVTCVYMMLCYTRKHMYVSKVAGHYLL